MRVSILLVITAASLLPLSAAVQAEEQFCPECAGLKTLGTSLHFAEAPGKAARLARENDRLLFVLHLSGNFAQEEFT